MTRASEAVEVPGVPSRLRPRPLEVASGVALGLDPDSPRLPGIARDPRAAIESAVRRALARPPCLVSFSGGRDSSAVLAVAVAVARRDGVAPPVPVSYRFASAPGSREDEWQEQVVRHLRLADWERMPLTTELDVVGPAAQQLLTRHGLLWPFNAHFHLPVLERAAGGSVLTGMGGDEVFAPQLWASARAAFGGVRRGRKVHVRSVAAAAAPRAVRRWIVARHGQPRWPWMRPAVEAGVTRQLADWRARTPVAWPGAIEWWWRSRFRTIRAAVMDALAAGAGATIVHPFLDEAVVASLTAHYGRAGPVDRSAAMRDLFADVLPEAVLTRRTKAWFDEAFVSDHSRAFAAAWTGAGVDPSLVDPDRLAAEWRSPRPDPRSLLLMQSAWLGSR